MQTISPASRTPLRLNTRKSDKALLVSLAASVVINAAVAALLFSISSGIRDHVFLLLSSDDSVLEVEIGAAYDPKPAAPRFADELDAWEERADADAGTLAAEREREARDDPLVPAAMPEERAPPPPMSLEQVETTAKRDAQARERGWRMNDPETRIAPENDLLDDPYGAPAARSPADVKETRFEGGGDQPTLARARPGPRKSESASRLDGENRESGIADGRADRPLSRRAAAGRRIVRDADEIDNLTLDPPPDPEVTASTVWVVEEKRYDDDIPRPIRAVVAVKRAKHVGEAASLDRIDGPAIAEFADRRPGQGHRRIRQLRGETAEPESSLDLDPVPDAPEPVLDDMADGGSGRVRFAGGFAVIYPERSIRLGETGEVTVVAEISAEGRCLSARVERSSGYPSLDQAALDAVRRARFHPGVVDGEAAPTSESVEIEFRLN